MSRGATGLSLLAGALALGWASAGAQSVVLFSGVDTGVSTSDARPNSDAAGSSFDAAAVMLGDNVLNVLDFEGAPLGDFTSLSAADVGVAGLSILAAGGSDGDDTRISSSNSQIKGFNTTPGGSRFLQIEENGTGEPAVGITFRFANPIVAFGAYFTGLDTMVEGVATATFSNGSLQSFALDQTSFGGSQFWGFTSSDPNSAIREVRVVVEPEGGINSDVIGIDDVGWVVVPEPSSTFLLAIGVSGLLLRRRR